MSQSYNQVAKNWESNQGSMTQVVLERERLISADEPPTSSTDGVGGKIAEPMP